MKKISSFLKNKVILGAALIVATVGIGSAVSNAGFGPDRPTKQYVQGQPGFDHVTFNSFTGVPNIGDERDFMTGKIASAPNGFYDPMNQVRDGNEILVRVYVHNNADTSQNASGNGVARNTRVRVQIPEGQLAQAHQNVGYISADNAQPQVITDTLDINANYPFQMDYVEGSAKITTNFMNDVPLSDEITRGGVLIGDDALDGQMPGCFEYVALVTYRVKIEAPNYNMQKTVRLEGEDRSQWREQATAKPGDTVEWKLEFKNTGATQLNGVDIFDQLPANMTMVPNTTMIYNGNHPNGVNAGNNNVISNGIDVGNYQSNTNAIVTFKAKVPTEDKLTCGRNTFLNKGFAKPEGQGTVTDNASVVVDKTCQNPAPVYACDSLKAEYGTNRTVKFTANATGKDGATVQRYIFNFGDGSEELATSNSTVTHTYPRDGQFNARVKVQFQVNERTEVAESSNCAVVVSFNGGTPVKPATSVKPTSLPAAGPTDVALAVIAVTIASSLGYAVVARRF
jgi:uncharacterized repeat protein (TIGR01451 family)